MAVDSTEVAVIGAGPGGYAAAFRAADLGLRTTLVDLSPLPGGVCLQRGCIPSKALLHVARLLREAREAAAWGVTFAEPDIDLDALRSWKNDVVGQLTGGLGSLCDLRNVAYVQGRATFKDAHTIEIDRTQGGPQTLTFEHAIVATGSEAQTIPGVDMQSPRVMDATGALNLVDIPPRLLVIGGGYIGLEMATVYSALGSQVTVVEMMKTLLPGVDRDLVRTVAKAIEQQVHAVFTSTKVSAFREDAQAMHVTFEGPDAPEGEQPFDRVLVSVGRRPNSAGLGLEHTNVRITERGFVETDARCRTAEPTIYAIGDVAGNPMLAHKATREGAIAAEVIAGHNVAFEPTAIPAVVFTDPELAWCGLTETQAKEAKRKVKVSRFPWSASGRALTLGRTDGFTKLLLDRETEQVLGVGIAGPGAGELIAEGVLAVEMGATAADLANCIHPHPTLSETVMESAEAYFGKSPHLYRGS